VDDKIHVVQKHPVGLAVALDVGGSDSALRESLLYLIRDGLNLPRVATRADDKVIREGPGVLIHLQNGDFLGLFGLRCANCLKHLGHSRVRRRFGHV
jgi:hypothetical protein